MYKKIIAEKAAKAKKNIIFRKVVHSLALTSALFASYITPASASPQDKMPSTVIVASVDATAERKVKELIMKLSDGDYYVRARAAEALGEMGPAAKDAVPALIKLCGDSDSDVRGHAAEALGEMGPAAKDAVPALIKLCGDSDSDVRGHAAVALGEMGPDAKDAIPALKKLCGDSDSDGESYVRESAAEALVKMGPDAVPALIKLCGDSDRVRSSAAEALGKMAPAAKDAIPVLIKLSEQGISNATKALGEIGYISMQDADTINQLRYKHLNTIILSPAGSTLALSGLINECDKNSAVAAENIVLLGALDSEKKSKSITTLLSNGFVKEALLLDLKYALKANEAHLAALLLITLSLLVSTKVKHRDKIAQLPSSIKFAVEHYIKAGNYRDRYFQPNAKDYFKFLLFSALFVIAAKLTPVKSDLVYYAEELWLILNMLNLNKMQMSQLLRDIVSLVPNKIDSLILFHKDSPGEQAAIVFKHLDKLDTASSYADAVIELLGKRKDFPALIALLGNNNCYYAAKNALSEYGPVSPELIVHCPPAHVPELYNLLKITDKGLTLEAIKKCDPIKMHQLAAHIPNIDKDIVLALIEHSDWSSNMLDLYSKIPALLRTMDITKAAVNKSRHAAIYNEIPQQFRTPEILKMLIAVSDVAMLNRIEQNIKNNECQIESDDDKEELLSLITNRAVRLKAEEAAWEAREAEREAREAAREAREAWEAGRAEREERAEREAMEKAAFEEQRWYR